MPLALVLVRLARRSDRRVGLALVYHEVGDQAGDPRRELVPAHGASLFARQARHLASRYRVVPASRLLAAASERRRGEPFPVALTFDDDLPSHLETAAPILRSASATATFYVSGASLREPSRFWWERLQDAVDRGLDVATLEVDLGGGSIHELGRAIEGLPPEKRDEIDRKLARLVGPDPAGAGLRSEALRSLAASGFEIGFHTLRHDPLPALGDDELARAMHEGRAELEELLGSPLTTISYPHGAADARVADAARSAGFESGFTGRRSLVTPGSEPLLLGRLSPSYDSAGELAFDVAWRLFRASSQR